MLYDSINLSNLKKVIKRYTFVSIVLVLLECAFVIGLFFLSKAIDKYTILILGTVILATSNFIIYFLISEFVAKNTNLIKKVSQIKNASQETFVGCVKNIDAPYTISKGEVCDLIIVDTSEGKTKCFYFEPSFFENHFQIGSVYVIDVRNNYVVHYEEKIV